MKQAPYRSGLLLATAAAALFANGTTLAAEKDGAQEAKVQCAGINACKGQSACSTASNACSGQNACKGQGWLYAANKAECEAKGGKVISK
ncbi:hypothetical protein [Methylococcus sp. EFPC2]|uniref:BufA2 family periplasmic bufferin-type metallophore n=1 Tax=Methylococcus sp. EFPC2 TaxID=2812648 RepID=UPI001966E98F|nr:hypothetical protein [Methylococcus sp. EFPC2]QSA98911.1 hypothetical protein JWZ97_09105 [Methylococcus sp. EFPC2]